MTHRTRVNFRDIAIGLPDGSIRAVIALSLIVLFSTCSVYLFKGISDGKTNTIARLSDEDRNKFLRDHASLPDLQSAISKDDANKDIIAKDAAGNELKNPDGSLKYLYDVTYSGSTNAASLDFAKQLLTLLGTLMTAITSFYLGAGTVTSATAVAQAAGTAKPTISAIDPSSFAISEGTLQLKILGANLNAINAVRIVRGDVTIIATNVHSNATEVTCDIDVGKAAAGAWDVVVDNGGPLQAILKNALKLT